VYLGASYRAAIDKYQAATRKAVDLLKTR